MIYVVTGRPHIYNALTHGPGFKLYYAQDMHCPLAGYVSSLPSEQG